MKIRIPLTILLLCIGAGFVIPERIAIPVSGASTQDWNAQTFWHWPWGPSGVHKGIDIFARRGRAVISATDGLVLYRGHIPAGGNVVLVLGPKWRLHYYAHLESITVAPFSPVACGRPLGTVGSSGNAKGKPPHLHYSIVRMLPAPWAMDGAPQGYKKAFYLNPDAYLRHATDCSRSQAQAE